MKSRNTLIGAVLPLGLLAGCAANMSERGTWTGTGKLVNLYESSGKSVPALAIDIDPGQIRKKTTVDDHPILIDKHLAPIPPGPYVGKRLRVKGLIHSENPINPSDNEVLWADPPGSGVVVGMNGVTRFVPVQDVWGVIKVAPTKVEVLPNPKAGQASRIPLLEDLASDSNQYPPPGANENIVQTIWVGPDEENTVADLYDQFLTLLAGGRIEAGAKLPASNRFVTETKAYSVFHWAYHIAPMQVRGFEISIPKGLLRQNDGDYIVTKELEVKQVAQRQGIKIIVMKRGPLGR